ncbi:MAG: ABC transporter permease subunit [Chloroflexi bacterium]|nr:ABC transporter permease subunit [Chloroflexota bacterium]MBM3155101.1 ABC transporter permease subunit [Chloroflexota bacterium]MBM3166062.1 ABC transporter permease subunit [Chloroflexota bacterium]
MEEIWNGFVKAIQLIVTLDPEVMEITGRSLAIAAASCLLATAICIPLGSLIHFNRFAGKRALINVIQTMYSVPTVVIGLLVFLLFSRAGPLGYMELLFTPTVMVIGQAVLIAPIVAGLTITALSGVDKAVPETATALGADRFQVALLTMREARFAMLTAIVMGFGRAISEVGLALMVGGNIRGYTRVLTTAIALETSKGDIELSIALGIILIAVALIINIALNRLQQRK